MRTKIMLIAKIKVPNVLGTLHILLNLSVTTTLWGYFLPHFTEEKPEKIKSLAVVNSLVSGGACWWGLKGEITTCKENRS